HPFPIPSLILWRGTQSNSIAVHQIGGHMDYPENRLEGNVQQKNTNLDLNRYHTADQQQKTGELMLENAACELQELEESDSVQLF
ncbi:MAG: hypothetical protein VXX42_02495, partial [SAR324 cluster bacterium]|nr:hypothetical protein [SAR324 cluster bacterium]